MTLRLRAQLLLSVLVLAPGCAPEPQESTALWMETVDETGWFSLDDATCDQCLNVAERIILGEGVGPDEFLIGQGLSRGALVDDLGRYWVPQLQEIKVFAPDGDYLRTVGGKGQGPMEFGAVQLSHVGDGGTIHALDSVNARETLIGSDFELVETRRFEGRFFDDFDYLGDGRYVAQVRVDTADGIGLPLHIIDRNDVLLSFGALAGEDDPVVTSIHLRRRVAVSPDGLIYSAREHAYEVEAWDQNGHRRGGLRGPQLNIQPPKPGPFSRDNPYVSRVSAIGLEGDHLLWVGTWQLRPDWQDHVVEVMAPTGTLYLRPADGLQTSVYTSRIDVVDLVQKTIVASHPVEGLLVRFLNGRRAAAVQYGHDGNVRLTVLRMRLEDR